MKGVGDQIDYGMRVYDPRAGRFYSVDPLAAKYPWYTPYQFAGNKPIAAADLDGMEEWMRTQENLLRQNAIMRIDATHVQTLPISRSQTLSATPFKDQVQQYQQAQYRIQRYQEIGYNDDGTKPAWVRLAENKTFKNFSQNVALPLLEGYSYLDGVGELRSFFKGAKEAATTFLRKKEFDALARSGTVDAKAIRFSQNSISASFKDGSDVQALIDQLKSGKKIDIEPIRIIHKDNMVFTLDNRRLYAYQQAGVEVPYVKLDNIPKREAFKFTTTNNGVSIEVRRPTTNSQTP